jgi:polyphosphate kinase 2 (PPK2 family)
VRTSARDHAGAATIRAMGALDDVDLRLKLSRSESERRIAEAQQRLLELRLRLGGLLGDGSLGPPVCVLFEGWDASGKGGAIRRLVAPLDPRHVRVAQFSAPDEPALRHHFLWRFWPVLPGRGGMAVLDRSWYGRVLVERVEGLITKGEYKSAYEDIIGFEQMLAHEGTVLIKFWLHVSSAEQLRRFKARAADPLKNWKLTEDDWHNRKRRKSYLRAIAEMLERTDTEAAPWNLVAADSKHYARVNVLETVNAEIERAYSTPATRR